MTEWEWQLLEDKAPVERVSIGGADLGKGDRVILRPRPGADLMDLALTGKTAIIHAIEQDYENSIQIAVVLEDDPGMDMGVLRQSGHRFFFRPEEVEPLPPTKEGEDTQASLPKILVAGIGNIFHGDDAFGVEVSRKLAALEFPHNIRVGDFGIRSYDLAYALLDGYDTAILIDACSRGGAPGDLYVLELDAGDSASGEASMCVDPHTMNPMRVLQMARAMGKPAKEILLVGCEPATLGGEDGAMGLSEPVEAAVSRAVECVESLVNDILARKQE